MANRLTAEVRGRGEGHAGEVLQGPGLPGAQLHRQGRQARQPVPVSEAPMEEQKLNKYALSFAMAISHKYICLNKNGVRTGCFGLPSASFTLLYLVGTSYANEVKPFHKGRMNLEECSSLYCIIT